MWQQDINWLGFWVGKEGIRGFGGLPISASLIDRRLGLGTEGFCHDQQSPVQALVAQVQSVELTDAPSRINVLSHGSSIMLVSAWGGIVLRHVINVTSGSRNTLLKDTGNSQQSRGGL